MYIISSLGLPRAPSESLILRQTSTTMPAQPSLMTSAGRGRRSGESLLHVFICFICSLICFVALSREHAPFCLGRVSFTYLGKCSICLCLLFDIHFIYFPASGHILLIIDLLVFMFVSSTYVLPHLSALDLLYSLGFPRRHSRWPLGHMEVFRTDT